MIRFQEMRVKTGNIFKVVSLKTKLILTVAARRHDGRVVARRGETAAIVPWVFDFDNIHGRHAVWILNNRRCKIKIKQSISF